MSKILIAVPTAVLALALTVSAAVAGNGPPGIGFYVDDELFRTVGTPTDFSATGAPDGSYDIIYALGGDLMNVAESQPTDTDYNGGRWMVLPITWNVEPVQLTSAEDVLYYESQGWLDIGEPVKYFECPVIPAH